MATLIRPEISEKSQYYIDKHRYYELKHFCLQYQFWKKSYAAYNELCLPGSIYDRAPSGNVKSDPTARYAMLRARYAEKIRLIEAAAIGADPDLYSYILKGVTEGLSYTYLKTTLGMPCGRDMYYERYRKFFWLLSEARD